MMRSSNSIVTAAIILLILPLLINGCIEEENAVPAQGLGGYMNASSGNLSLPSGEENMPEINIASFSSIYMHDNSDQKDIYLFGWENVPGNESHRLLSLLHDDYRINWAENAQITKDDVNKTIHVFNNENSIEILLNNSGVQKIGDIYYDLWVKEENGTHKVYEKKYGTKYDISERYYAVYDISIKNNGSSPLYFNLNDLRQHEGDRIFNATTHEPYVPGLLGVLNDLANDNKLRDTALLPRQSLNGTATFRMDSLYNESFLLMYDTIPVTSESFEKSIEALRTAEHFNYFAALGIFPYTWERRGVGTDDPMFDDKYFTWANWLNRSIFETFQKSDVERMRKSPPDFIPVTKIVYALKVMPEKNITIFPVATRFTNHLIVINDAGNEIINTSDVQHRTNIIGFLSNQTYIQPGWIGNIPQMNFSNSYIVQISFEGTYGWPLNSRMSINNQDVILNDGLNINVVRSEHSQFLS